MKRAPLVVSWNRLVRTSARTAAVHNRWPGETDGGNALRSRDFNGRNRRFPLVVATRSYTRLPVIHIYRSNRARITFRVSTRRAGRRPSVRATWSTGARSFIIHTRHTPRHIALYTSHAAAHRSIHHVPVGFDASSRPNVIYWTLRLIEFPALCCSPDGFATGCRRINTRLFVTCPSVRSALSRIARVWIQPRDAEAI